MEQKQKEEAGRLSELRKYIPTPEDAELVKEMIADGLSNEDILHALGHTEANPDHRVLPNGHEYSNEMTTEQKEREEQAAGLGQPGEDVGESDDEGDEGDRGQDLLSHVAGLLTHVTRQKAKKGPKKSGNAGN